MMDIRSAGENAVIVYLGHTINPDTLGKVRQLVACLERRFDQEIIDLIPSYASLVVVFDPRRISHRQLKEAILAMPLSTAIAESNGTIVELPVYYSTQSSPDLEPLARDLKLSTDEVIHLHSAREYLVYAIGFAPGFAYLGEVDERIARPRLATPRPRVRRGAVAIAGRQTAVYPAQSPGGWNLIGLCPTPMFDPAATPSMPVQVGDRVTFCPVSKADFLQLGGIL